MVIWLLSDDPGVYRAEANDGKQHQNAAGAGIGTGANAGAVAGASTGAVTGAGAGTCAVAAPTPAPSPAPTPALALMPAPAFSGIVFMIVFVCFSAGFRLSRAFLTYHLNT